MVEIEHRDVVLFLGAGFSANAGLPVMGSFADAANQELMNLRNQLARPGARFFIEPGETWELLRERCQAGLDKQFFDGDNIEELYQFAESLIYDDAPGIELKAQVNNRDEQRMYGFDYLEQMLALWTWKIYQRLPIVDDAPKREPYCKMFCASKELWDRIVIVTTNYDLVPEFAAAVATDGDCQCAPAVIRNDIDRREENVDVDDRQRSWGQHTIPIVKLHGSVDLFTAMIDDQLRLIWANKRDKNANPGDGWKFAALQLNALVKLRRRIGESVTPAIVPPTFSKARRYSWIDATWRAGFKALKQARHIVFIGYSLPPSDGHMRGLLAAAFAARKDKPIVWVSNKCEETVDQFAKWFEIGGDRKFVGKFETMHCELEGWLERIARDSHV